MDPVHPGNADSALLRSLRAAVEANPEDVPLRLHLAELLLEVGAADEAIGHIAAALQRVPGSAKARALMARAVSDRDENTFRFNRPVPATPRRRGGGDEPTERHTFNWAAAEGQFTDVPQPFVDSGTAPLGEPLRFDVESGKFRFADVRGMTEVKRRLTATVINPARNYDPRRGQVGGAGRGGLLMYGPPGCGKTFIARAVAGELSARFLAVNLLDGPEIYEGSAERNLREIFAEVRRAAPCVLLLDELDAIGRNRGLVNQLLVELDAGLPGRNAPIVLAASASPWDIDPVLRRPGRLERTLLVTPPDQQAREAILHTQLRDRRLAPGANLRELAARTEEFSVTDLAQLCELAAAHAAADKRGGRLIGVRDFDAALAEVRASTGAWLSMARNAAKFGGPDGSYDDLHRYLKSRRMA